MDDTVLDEGLDIVLEESELYEFFHHLVGNNFVDTGYHWGYYVVFMDWVSRFNGDAMARRVDKKLRKEVPHHLPSIPYLIIAKVRASCCGGPRTTPDA